MTRIVCAGLILVFFLAGCVGYPGTEDASTSGIVTDASGHQVEGASVGIMLLYPGLGRPIAFAHTTSDHDGRFSVHVKHVVEKVWFVGTPAKITKPTAVCAACKKGTAMIYFPCGQPGRQVTLPTWESWTFKNRSKLFFESLSFSDLDNLGVLAEMLPECENSFVYHTAPGSDTSTKIEGIIVDQGGKPIPGAVVHAVRIHGVVGKTIGEADGSRLINHDRFITDEKGHYLGNLGYVDYHYTPTDATYGGLGVIYYACRPGYRPAWIDPLLAPISHVQMIRGDENATDHSDLPSKLTAILNAPLCE